MIIKFFKFFIVTLSVIMAIGPVAWNLFGDHLKWEPAQFSLNQNSSYLAIPAGGASVGSAWTQKSYLLIPKGWSLPTMLTVFETGAIIRSQFGFWLYLLLFCFGWFHLIRFFKNTFSNASNKET